MSLAKAAFVGENMLRLASARRSAAVVAAFWAAACVAGALGAPTFLLPLFPEEVFPLAIFRSPYMLTDSIDTSPGEPSILEFTTIGTCAVDSVTSRDFSHCAAMP